MASSDDVPYHLKYGIDGKLIEPEAKTLEEHAAWYVGLAQAIWLDLWYLVLAVLALLLLITCCVCVPGLRDLSLVKEKVKPVADWTLAKTTAAAAAIGACLGATWASIAQFFSDLLSKCTAAATPTAVPASAVPAYVPLDEEAGTVPAPDPTPPPPEPEPEPEPAPVPVVVPAAPSTGAGPAVGVGTLTLHLKSGFKLEGKDKSGKSDPFCLITMPGEKTAQSVVIKQSLSPVWNQHFTASGKTLQALGAIGPIKIDVYDKDMGSKEALGSLVLPANKWTTLEAGQVMQFNNQPLTGATTGQISFNLTFEPSGSQPPNA